MKTTQKVELGPKLRDKFREDIIDLVCKHFMWDKNKVKFETIDIQVGTNANPVLSMVVMKDE
jgi:septum formation topological specificity factor MinE